MESLADLASALTEGVKVNVSWREVRSGGAVWLKRRRAMGGPILAAANVCFRLIGAPVQALARVEEWQRWEIDSYRLLHEPEGYDASAEGAAGVGCAELPGRNLTDFLDGGTMTPQMAAAAARELRRAHGLGSAFFGGGWSHGDAHAGNFVYDEERDRARLIDFELRHRVQLGTEERQFDDVLGFLLDLVGRIAAERWTGCAIAFLQAYGKPDLTAALLRPETWQRRGAAALWVRVRTTFLPMAELRRRWTSLALALQTNLATERPGPRAVAESGVRGI